MREILSNPPLVEVICDLTFSSAGWNGSATAEAFAATLQDRYPEASATTHSEYDFTEGPEGEPVLEHRKLPRWRISAPNRPIVIQIGAGVVSVSHQPPYDRWEVFRETLDQVLVAFKTVLQPTQVERASLRYINHFAVPNRSKVRDFVCVGPKPPQAAESRLMTHFYQRYDFTFEEGVLVHQTAIAKINDVPGVVLDLEFVSVAPIPTAEIKDLERWLEAAHDVVGDVFRTSVNPEYYESLRRNRTS